MNLGNDDGFLRTSRGQFRLSRMPGFFRQNHVMYVTLDDDDRINPDLVIEIITRPSTTAEAKEALNMPATQAPPSPKLDDIIPSQGAFMTQPMPAPSSPVFRSSPIPIPRARKRVSFRQIGEKSSRALAPCNYCRIVSVDFVPCDCKCYEASGGVLCHDCVLAYGKLCPLCGGISFVHNPL